MNGLTQPTPTNLNIFDFSSREQSLATCKEIISSDLCPKWAKGNPGNLLLVLMKGFELGLSVSQAMDGLCIINGKVSMYGDVLFGFCYGQPDREYIEEEFDNKTHTYLCRAKRKSRNEVKRTFSLADADKAGLLKKEGPWRLYPLRMLQMRARSWCLRDTWPDRLMGIIAYEEALDCTSSSNIIEFQPTILETTKAHLTFLIQNTQLTQDKLQKMLAWANAKCVDEMSELKAIQAIKSLERENPEAAKAWKDLLVVKLEAGDSHAD